MSNNNQKVKYYTSKLIMQPQTKEKKSLFSMFWCLLLADNIELTHKYELAIRLTELVHSSRDEFSLHTTPSEGRLWFRPVLIIR